MDNKPDLTTAWGRLAWARERAGYKTAADFARKVRVNPISYRAYEAGQNGYAKRAAEFAKNLNVSAGWLLSGGALPSEAVPAPPQPWLPTPETLAELLAVAMHVDDDDLEKLAELRDYASAVRTGLEWIAEDPAIEADPKQLKLVRKRVAEAIAAARSSSSKVA